MTIEIDIDIERERIKCVFGLGGGELFQPNDDFLDEWDGVIAHWFEGVPDYATELRHLDEARTATIDCMFGIPEAPKGWKQVASFRTSGERECWWCAGGAEDGNEDEREGCQLCEGDGLTYIGEGWCEVVYSRPTDGLLILGGRLPVALKTRSSRS